MKTPIEKLNENVDNVYRMVILAAKRSRQLADGAPKLVDSKGAKFSTLALLEIAEGKIKYEEKVTTQVD